MNVLLTGATGFLGSRILDALTRRSINVIALTRSTTDAHRIASVMPHVTCHVIGTTPIERVFEESQVDVVIHAATVYGRRGETPTDIVDGNVLFPLRLLQASARFGARAFLNADSFSTKGRELPAGLEHYTLSKRHFREFGELFARTGTTRFVTLRIEHMYGSNDNPTKFLPWLLQTLLMNTPRCDLTAGEQLRDFVHVDDVVNAFLALADRHADLSSPSDLLEVGTGNTTTLRSFVELAHELSESQTELFFGALDYRPGELMRSEANTEPLRRIGWSPQVSLRDGLEQTIAAARQTLPIGTDARLVSRGADGRLSLPDYAAEGRLAHER